MPVYMGTHSDHLALFLRTATGQIVAFLLALGIFFAFMAVGIAFFSGGVVGTAGGWFASRHQIVRRADLPNLNAIEAIEMRRRSNAQQQHIEDV